jgi:hypothetical protein
MNLDLLDPKVIVLAAVVVILIIAGAVWLYVPTTQEYHCRPAAKVRT